MIKPKLASALMFELPGNTTHLSTKQFSKLKKNYSTSILLLDHYFWSSHTYARHHWNAGALFVLPHSHSVTSQGVVL